MNPLIGGGPMPGWMAAADGLGGGALCRPDVGGLYWAAAEVGGYG